MSDKPQSAFKNGTTQSFIFYDVEVDGVTYKITENLDTSLNGKTGLPLSINARPPAILGSAGQLKYNDFDALANKDITSEILKSSDREQKYHTRMNELRVKALENGTSDQFEKNLVDNGVYDAIAGSGSINEVPLTTNDSRNELESKIAEQIQKDTERAESAEARRFRESIQVKNEALAYPPHLKGNKGEDYIYIEQFEYSPPQPSKKKMSDEEFTNSLGTVLDKGIQRTSNIERPRGSCRLPIPNKLGVSNGVSWGEARANAVELAAFQSATGAIGKTLGGETNIGELIKGGLTDAGNIFNKIKKDFKETGGSEANSASVISAVLARSALSQIGINVDVDQFIIRQEGAAINPNLELLFGGPQLRTFSFNFNFAPESPEEAVEVRKIQRWFKQGMLPSRSFTSRSNNLFLGSPNVFKIQYRNQSRRIKGLNIIKVCAMTACQIDFTPDGTYQSYSDSGAVSMPVRSTMGLTFNELTPIFSDDYAGFDGVPYKDNRNDSIKDLGTMLTGANSIDDNDVGF